MNCTCKSFLTQLHASNLSPCIAIFTQVGGGYIVFGSNCRITDRGAFLGTGTEVETLFDDISMIEIPQSPHPTSDELVNDLEVIQSCFPEIPFIRTRKLVNGKSQEVLTLSFQPTVRKSQTDDSKPGHVPS